MGTYHRWHEDEGQGQNEVDCWKGSADEADKAEKEENRNGEYTPISEYQQVNLG